MRNQMKNSIYFLFVLALFSCGEKEPLAAYPGSQDFSQQQIDSILTVFKFEYASPVFIDSSDHLLLPVTTQFLEKRKIYSSEGYYTDEYPRYWNILFYNKNSGEVRMLTESKFRVSDFSVNLEEAGPVLSKSILYRIGDTDYNQDRKLNHEDPEQLFISQTDGTGLFRLSPPDEKLQSYTIIPHSDQLIVRTTRDVNNDFKFDKNDEEIWYKIDVAGDLKPKEMVDSLSRKKIQNLYFEQWLKKK